jgi:hypothetical protein
MERVFGQDERCWRLAKVEGVGPLTATALVAAVGNAHEFKSGRELSAWLGLVPRQSSSGGRNVLLGIAGEASLCGKERNDRTQTEAQPLRSAARKIRSRYSICRPMRVPADPSSFITMREAVLSARRRAIFAVHRQIETPRCQWPGGSNSCDQRC